MTYRTGRHWGVTIVREGVEQHGIACYCVSGYTDPVCAGLPSADQLVAVVTNGDQALAERICALLNADEPYEPPSCGCPVVRLKGRGVQHSVTCPEGDNARFVVNAPPADSCTCVYRPNGGADPACVIHQGRRARGPKPPNPPGCVCDGSGRRCPRHGEVM